MNQYVIFDYNKGYLTNGEDNIGCIYDHEIHEYTVRFGDLKDAKFNCGNKEVIVIVEGNEIIGVASIETMDKESVKSKYGVEF